MTPATHDFQLIVALEALPPVTLSDLIPAGHFKMLLQTSARAKKAIVAARIPMHLRMRPVSPRNGSPPTDDLKLADLLRMCTWWNVVGLTLDRGAGLREIASFVNVLGMVSTSLRTLSLEGLERSKAFSCLSHPCEAMADALQHCTGLTSLDVSDNPVRGWRWARAVDPRKLVHLSISYSMLNVAQFGELCGILTGMSHLECLNLESVVSEELRCEDLVAVGSCLTQMTGLRCLYLGNVQVNAEAQPRLGPVLGACTALVALELKFSKIQAVGAQSLTEHLSRLDKLKKLNLQGCSLGDAAAGVLAPGLAAMPLLDDLNLGNNGLGPAGVAALVICLHASTSLRDLRLSRNSIGGTQDDVLTFAGGLPGLQRLGWLNLSGISLGDGGATALAPILAGCRTLRGVNLHGNDLGNEGHRALREALNNRVRGL